MWWWDGGYFSSCRWNLFVLYFVPWASQRNIMFNQDKRHVGSTYGTDWEVKAPSSSFGPWDSKCMLKIYRYVEFTMCHAHLNPTYFFLGGTRAWRTLPIICSHSFGFLIHSSKKKKSASAGQKIGLSHLQDKINLRSSRQLQQLLFGGNCWVRFFRFFGGVSRWLFVG